MKRQVLALGMMLPLAAAAFGCAGREEIQAERMAEQAAAEAKDDAACRAQGAPGSAEYNACRQALAAQRAEKAEIEYQKRRYFDRVLGAGADGINDY